MIDYRDILQKVTYRMLWIKDDSLNNDSLNEEWRELVAMQGNLIRLIKIEEKRNEEIV